MCFVIATNYIFSKKSCIIDYSLRFSFELSIVSQCLLKASNDKSRENKEIT